MNPANEEVVVIEFVNYEKHIINFVKDKENFGFFKYGPQFKNPRVGDLLRVKLEKSPDNNYYKVLSLKPAQAGDTCEALMEFAGPINIAPKSGFGFVNEIFIYPRLVKHFNLVNGQMISGKAVLSFDKKKNTWGWIGCKVDV
jgi:hypothetical protein